jgi:peroxiredoxin
LENHDFNKEHDMILKQMAGMIIAVTAWMANVCLLQADDEASQRSLAKIGEPIAAFELTDYQGRQWKSNELFGEKGTVIAFLGTQCPLAKQYTKRIASLDTEFRDQGMRFIAIDSNIQDSLAEMAAHARRFDLQIPFLKDPNQHVADACGATRTPEVCVVDSKRVLRYRGRIDDQYGIGYAKDDATKTELRDAIESILKSEPVAVSLSAAPGCLIGRSIKSAANVPAESITYAEHVAPILQARCVACHRDGDIGPMDLNSYDDAAAWADMIVEVTQDRRMPPWHANPEYGHFANDRRLSDQELKLITDWARNGAPRGDSTKEPAKLTFTDGWLLPETPDLVVPMADKPYQIPAQGEVRYQYFVTDLKNPSELWFRGMEVVAGNREVVHHILIFAREKGTRGMLGGERSFLVGYVPGTRAELMPAGYAKRIPANSQLIFQVHYTPNGSPQEDLSKVGFVTADPSSITHEVLTSSAVNPRFRIPPGDADYRTTAMLPERLPECELLAMSPHMHVRGKAFRYTLVLPDKSREILLDVPRYDFNWQTEYRLSEKRTLPKGSRIFCEAAFDNSENNLNNPNPKAWVTWGDQTYEEMMIGYFHYAVPKN